MTHEITVRENYQPKPRNRYPFALLKRKGQHFVWPDAKDAHSIRVQASRLRQNGIRIRVSVTKEGVVVYHAGSFTPEPKPKPKPKRKKK